MSGVIPQVAALMGPCAAGTAYIPGLADFVPMVKGRGSMALAGPHLVRAAVGEDVTQEELGGSRVHCRKSGVGDLEVADDEECIARIKQYLSFFPSHCEQAPPVREASDPADRMDEALLDLLPESNRKPYDMYELIRRIVDDGEWLDLKPQWAKTIITCLARMGGRPVGIVANQPRHLGGILDNDSADKAARFVNLCNAFGIPLLFLVDVPGFMVGTKVEAAGIIRHGAKMLHAVAAATVPKLTVVVRKAYGAGYYVMNGRAYEPDLIVAWPSAEISVMGAEGAVEIVFRKQVEEAEDPVAKKAELIDAYRALIDVYVAARNDMVDDVIDPRETRPVVIRGSRCPPASGWSAPTGATASSPSDHDQRRAGRAALQSPIVSPWPETTVQTLDALPLSVMLFEAAEDGGLVLRAVNRAASENIGFDLRPLVGRPAAEIFPAGSPFTDRVRELALTQTGDMLDLPYGDDRVEQGWYRVWCAPAGGRSLLVTSVNVSEERRREIELAASARLNRSIIDVLREGIIVVDASTTIRQVNPAVVKLFGLGEDQFLGRDARELPLADADGRPLDRDDRPLVSALGGAAVTDRVVQLLRPDGGRSWLEINAVPLVDDDGGRPYGAVGSYTDVTRREEQERRARHEADHDALTGLANRRALHRTLEAALARADAQGSELAVLMVDLDGFKAVNDRFGHAAGDAALRQVAARLRQAVRGRDLVARIGGDEFVVLFPDVHGDAEALRDRVDEALREPLDIEGERVHLPAAVGLASFPGQASEVHELLAAADAAMYERKRGDP
jgi:diguanylate cyclase (GGDEF)-like protein/PAS domain S-box-containing protein